MSDNIPFEMQVEIMKNLPVKSLIQFRLVSKSWKHLIDTSDFITNHTGQHIHTQHLLIVSHYSGPNNAELKHVLIADDDSFPQHQFPLTLPLLRNMVKSPLLLGCSHGLVCWFNKGHYGSRAVVWNPLIRKTFVVAVNTLYNGLYDTVVGFGVCRETIDPKLLKITYVKKKDDIERIDCIPSQVEVFTLSGGTWRTSYGNLPRKAIRFDTSQVVINGILYLLASERDSRGDINLIISFDLTTEEFREVNLPHNLAHGGRDSRGGLKMSKLRDSLVLIQSNEEANRKVFVIWMMEDGVPELFTKLFTINTDIPHGTIMGFRKNGEPIIRIYEDDYKLVVYKTCSRHFDDLTIDGIGFPIVVYPYVETLLLLDQPDLKMFRLGN